MSCDSGVEGVAAHSDTGSGNRVGYAVCGSVEPFEFAGVDVSCRARAGRAEGVHWPGVPNLRSFSHCSL